MSNKNSENNRSRSYFTNKSVGNVSIYRKCEKLLDFTLVITSRLPKAGGGYSQVGQELVESIVKLMTSVLDGLKDEPGYYRLGHIHEAIKQMCIIKSLYNIIMDHSNRRLINTVSLGQQAEYLEQMNGLVTEMEKWRAKNAKIS